MHVGDLPLIARARLAGFEVARRAQTATGDHVQHLHIGHHRKACARELPFAHIRKRAIFRCPARRHDLQRRRKICRITTERAPRMRVNVDGWGGPQQVMRLSQEIGIVSRRWIGADTTRRRERGGAETRDQHTPAIHGDSSGDRASSPLVGSGSDARKVVSSHDFHPARH